MRTLKPGLKLRSAVCASEVMVIRAPGTPAVLACGGAEMLASGEGAPAGVALDNTRAGGTLIGKRYVDATDRLEVLCTKGGAGTLELDGTALEVKQAKALPSSD
ncbi:MAG: hypothetical protein JSR67_13825 [Proteobacteria bacterium]|nr:hypothetical protein [Pseudomonadota bacterium]